MNLLKMESCNMKLCVIMSIYKNDNLLAVTQSIESILRQAYEKIEFYIQLDGEIRSDVLQYLRGLCIQDIRVKILNRTLNRGLAYSLNELLNIVLTKEYEYIARMDADDISMPERFVKQIAFMNSHPDIDCLGTWAIEIDDDGKEYFRKKNADNS